MSNDVIKEKIIQMLDELEEEHELNHKEKDILAELVSNVARSDDSMRLFFYSKTEKVMEEIEKRLAQRKEEVLDVLMGKKKKSIIN